MSAPSLISSAKHQIRQDALAKRGSLSDVDRIEFSISLVDFLDDLPVENSKVVAGFWPIRDEIDPRPLMDALRQRGHELCLPVVSKPHLLFRELTRDANLVPAGFGTLAPDEQARLLIPNVLLMPLSGFDGDGNRIGYGKGHYDTAIEALSKKTSLICIGLAFSIQEVDRVPIEAHDKRLDGILTEKGYRSFV